ncbi:MAG TPA: hypothetical protein VFJ06_06380 [Halococcus sp.]|nr:hypothetical protein [Halococcus sp.]
MNPLLHLGMGHGPVSIGTIALPSVLLLAGITSLVIIGLAVVALAQRRSRSYLLITLALSVLLVRTVVGELAMSGMMARQTHHLAEHALDGVMAVLLLAAVYCARTTDPTAEEDRA